ncbi:hypothetical protein IW262DRAFT_1296941 [Armillaria fumosa]|nr:hypothetical protein IW262DRAFT_1296941 [Armillaria fumosa]
MSKSLQLSNIIVPFTLTTIDIGDKETWQNIKRQQEMHLILGLDLQKQANKIIQAGVIIEEKELQARKELPNATSCHPKSKYRYFMTEELSTWATYDVQIQAKTAHPSKVLGKIMNRPRQCYIVLGKLSGFTSYDSGQVQQW